MEMEGRHEAGGFFSRKLETAIAREVKELTHEIRGRRDNKRFLENENKKLKEEFEALKAELSGADTVISSLTNEIQATRERIEGFPESLKKLEAEKEALIEEINRCQSGIKTASRNTKNFMAMKGHLERELMNIINEKSVVLQQLRDMDRGVSMVHQQAAANLPYLKEYDMVLMQLRKVFREMENRMDVSVKFSIKKMS
jgi:chromosome segregation ATPase